LLQSPRYTEDLVQGGLTMGDPTGSGDYMREAADPGRGHRASHMRTPRVNEFPTHTRQKEEPPTKPGGPDDFPNDFPDEDEKPSLG
jgi:hypothetical protein